MPRLPLNTLTRHRHLLAVLLRREVASRTSGTALGWFWMLLQPALQVAAMWFLLDVVLKVRFPGLPGGFVPYYLTGMIPWLLLSEVIQRSLTVLNDYAALYQRSVFPTAVLPLLPLVVSACIYLVIYVVVCTLFAGVHGTLAAAAIVLTLTIWLLPLVYLLAVFGLFVRDLAQIAPFALTMMLYVTPILYVPQALPASLQWWLHVNPFAPLIALAHALVQGHAMARRDLLLPLAIWLLLLWPARRVYRRSEPHLREAL